MKVMLSVLLNKGKNTVEMPRGSIIRHIDEQSANNIRMWYETDSKEMRYDLRTFVAVESAQPLPDDGIYIGTVSVLAKVWTWHIYEIPDDEL